jgi:hypothetical protein
MRCEDENSLVILTYYVIKVGIFATRSVGGNVDFARWAFIVAFGDVLFDALPAESMTALRVDERVSVRLQTDRTAEVLIDDGLERRKGAL